jgi:hypothetical protein
VTDRATTRDFEPLTLLHFIGEHVKSSSVEVQSKSSDQSTINYLLDQKAQSYQSHN